MLYYEEDSTNAKGRTRLGTTKEEIYTSKERKTVVESNFTGVFGDPSKTTNKEKPSIATKVALDLLKKEKQ